MSVSSIPSRAEIIREQLYCPVALEPLSEAVSLVPCAHKVQQAVAGRIFGEVYRGWQVRSDKPCPVCRAPVLGYTVDHSIRSIVRQVFEPSERELNAMLAIVKKSTSVPKDVLAEIPYPGKPARFIHDHGDWSLVDSGADLCRRMVFLSSTQGSFLKEFSLLGYKCGAVMIYIKFLRGAKSFPEYLKKFDVILSSGDEDFGTYKSHNQEQLRSLFNIISQNNEIPDSHFARIREIVARGRC